MAGLWLVAFQRQMVTKGAFVSLGNPTVIEGVRLVKTTENRVLLSFVIPVYNVELYLGECLDSILCQTTESCEIVLVDDGATDSSGEICDRYADRYPTVKVIHKENGGLSSARNAGLSVAKGEYVTFVDSDDKVCPGSVTKLLDWINSQDADLCFLRAAKLFPNGSLTDLNEGIVGSELRGKPREAAIDYLSTRPKYPGCAWAKLFRRAFLTEHQLLFPFDRRYSEDLGFLRDCILCAERFDALDEPFYQYRQSRTGSITQKASAKNFYDLLLFISESAEKLTRDKQANDAVCRNAMSFAAYEYFVLLLTYCRIPKTERKAAIRKLAEYRWVLKYARSAKIKVVSRICFALGLRFTAFLTTVYRRVQMHT